METVNIILRIMEEKGISKYNVAKHCDFQNNLWIYWQSGRQKPGLTTLIKIADYLDVSLDYLVGRETPATAKQSQTNTTDNITTTLKQNQNTITNDAPINWDKLDEIQRSKVNGIIQGMLMTDIRKSPENQITAPYKA